MDMFSMWFRGQGWAVKHIKKVHNEHIIMDSLKNNRNVICVSYHFGNWELLGAYIGSKYPYYGVYKKMGNKLYDDIIQKYRRSCNMIEVPVDDTMQMRKVISALRNQKNTGLVILPDWRPKKNSGHIMADFFGIKTPSTTMPVKLLSMAKSDVVLICALNVGGGNYEVFIKKAPQEIYGKDTLAAIHAMNKEYEKLINLDLAQYNWFQDKFKYVHKDKGKPSNLI